MPFSWTRRVYDRLTGSSALRLKQSAVNGVGPPPTRMISRHAPCWGSPFIFSICRTLRAVCSLLRSFLPAGAAPWMCEIVGMTSFLLYRLLLIRKSVRSSPGNSRLMDKNLLWPSRLNRYWDLEPNMRQCFTRLKTMRSSAILRLSSETGVAVSAKQASHLKSVLQFHRPGEIVRLPLDLRLDKTPNLGVHQTGSSSKARRGG